MRFKTLITTSLLALAASSPVLGASANSLPMPPLDVTVSNNGPILIPNVELQNSAPVLLAQASSQQLEEQIRLLNGKVEEMNFLVLQLQEQMRKMQEDNEFRFQELEKSGQGGAAPQNSGSNETETPAAPETPSESSVDDSNAQTGAPPKELGTIKFDENGNPVAATVDDVLENTDVAAVDLSESAQEIYRVAYDHVLSGDYANAEQGFRKHISEFPQDKQTSDARYWLGEALAGQGKHREAAEILLDAQKDFPKAKKAPDMLLKLGVSLAALDNKDVACATFAQVSKKYPKAGPTLMSRVAEEQAKTGC